MNSKQRRASMRYWKHVIVLPYNESYVVDNERKEWCKKNIGKWQVNWVMCRDRRAWGFTEAKDAAWFRLKWE